MFEKFRQVIEGVRPEFKVGSTAESSDRVIHTFLEIPYCGMVDRKIGHIVLCGTECHTNRGGCNSPTKR
jgi:hypothetical protein